MMSLGVKHQPDNLAHCLFAESSFDPTFLFVLEPANNYQASGFMGLWVSGSGLTRAFQIWLRARRIKAKVLGKLIVIFGIKPEGFGAI